MADMGGGSELVFSDEQGNPIGYSTPLETLLANFTQHGGRIFYNHKVSAIKRSGNVKFLIEGVKDKTEFEVIAKSVTLNMGVQDINKLSRNSVMWLESKFDFEELLKSYGTTVAQKGYLHYEDPWWYRLLNRTTDSVSTDNPIRYFENFQTWPDCDVSEFKSAYCPAWTQVAYVTGVPYTAYWNSANTKNQDLFWLEMNDTVTKPFLLEAHRQFVDVYSKFLEEAGIDPSTIDPPNKGVFAYWEGGWAYNKANQFDGRHNRLMRKPLQPENKNAKSGDALCIVNTDFSTMPGEAEGSLISALEALKLCHNVQVPNIPSDFYKYIVNKVY
jgi:hypothetical protein